MLHEMGIETGIDLAEADRGLRRRPGGPRPPARRPRAARRAGRLAPLIRLGATRWSLCAAWASSNRLQMSMKSDRFRAAAEGKDFSAIDELFTEDVSFRSPVVFKPYEGREAIAMLLGAVVQVFEDFRYTDQVESGDTAVLLFEARVGDRELNGVDILRFDADGPDPRDDGDGATDERYERACGGDASEACGGGKRLSSRAVQRRKGRVETIEKIRNATFTLTRRGYDRREVDSYLSKLADWLEGGGSGPGPRRHDQARARADRPQDQPDPHRAQEAAEALRADAEHEARRSSRTRGQIESSAAPRRLPRRPREARDRRQGAAGGRGDARVTRSRAREAAQDRCLRDQGPRRGRRLREAGPQRGRCPRFRGSELGRGEGDPDGRGGHQAPPRDREGDRRPADAARSGRQGSREALQPARGCGDRGHVGGRRPTAAAARSAPAAGERTAVTRHARSPPAPTRQ